MALSSSSTLAEVEAQWDDNADYFSTSSVAKAKLFIEAGMILIRRLPKYMNKGAAAVSQPLEEIREQVNEAKEWLMARDDDSRPYKSTTRADFRGFRGYGGGGGAWGRGVW